MHRGHSPDTGENYEFLLRRFGIGLGCGLCLAATPALADTYPSKPIRLIVPFPASGATDLLARAIAQKVGASMGQQIVVDNRPGAGGAIGSDMAAKAAPDGYTLLIATTSTHSIGPYINTRLPYNTETDFTRSARWRSPPTCW